MRYYLSVHKKNMEPILIKGFNKLDGFENLQDSSLEDITTFTSMFLNELDLMEFLIQNNLISSAYFNGTFGINYYKSKHDIEDKTLPYGISFEGDKSFFRVDYLQRYFSSKLRNDDDFMERFLDKYYTRLKDVPIFSEELEGIAASYHTNRKDKLDDYIYKFIYFYTRKKNNDGFVSINFTRLRDLAMFAIDYERKINPEPILPFDSDLASLESLKEHYQSILNDGTPTEEEIEIYENAIANLEREIESYKNCLKRSKKQ